VGEHDKSLIFSGYCGTLYVTGPAVRSGKRVLVGCVRQYCCCRERKYCPFDDLNDFRYVIKVKDNAPELLRKALPRLPVDVIATGDYQAAEKKLEVSRRILEVCLDLGFPVSVLERSPLVLRDLDCAEGDQPAGALRRLFQHDLCPRFPDL